MFDFVHERKRLVQIILLLIILPFMFWGVESYMRSDGDVVLAKVEGEKVLQQEFDNAVQQQGQRLRELLGSNFDPAMLERADFKNALLDELVKQRLLALQARKAGLVLGDEQLVQIIAGVPAFQRDGKFDKETYKAALAAQGMSPQLFEARVRQELAAQQLTAAYAANGYAAAATVDTLIRLNEQQRVVSVARLELAPLLVQVKVSEEAVQAYYRSHSSEFQLPERVRVEYVLLDQAGLERQVAVSDADVAAYYEQHQAEFGTPELRHAAHILIAVPRQASSEEKAAARAKAQALLAELKQAPGKFSALARQHSQDPGSAALGGDLGEFGRGAMVKPFEEAVYGLKTGEISELVETDFGFHIIKLLGIKPASVPPLTAVRGVIVQRLKAQAAADRFAELSEKFGNTVYEQSDSLQPAASLIGGKVEQGPWLSKGQAPQGLWTAKVLQGVFSDDAIKMGRNIAAVELDGNRLLSARVVEHKPAEQRALAEVAAQIRSQLQRQQAMEMAAKQAEDLLAQLRSGAAVKLSWSPAKSLSRAQRDELTRAVFKADVSSLPAYASVPLPDGGHTLLRIEAVKEVGEIDSGKHARYAMQLQQATGAELLRAYLADVRAQADVSMRKFAPTEAELK